MRRRVQRLIESCADDLRVLDALSQWAETPTGYSAVRAGHAPDHTLIRTNVAARYDLSHDGAGEIFQRFVQSVGRAGLDVTTGYLEAGAEIRRQILEGGLLRDAARRRIADAPPDARYVAYLFCRFRDDFSIWPHSRDHQIYNERMRRFAALLEATFSVRLAESEILRALVRLGFVNELQWVNVREGRRGARRETEFVVPAFMEETLRDIEAIVHLPPVPDARTYVERLLAGGEIGPLAAFDDLVGRGWAEETDLVHEPAAEPGLVGCVDGIAAVNVRARTQVLQWLARYKEGLAADARNRIVHVLAAAGWQARTETMTGRVLLRIVTPGEPADRAAAAVLIVPWCTRTDLEMLAMLPPGVDRIAVTTAAGRDDVMEQYCRVFSGSSIARGWYFVGAAADRGRITTFGDSSPLVDAIVAALAPPAVFRQTIPPLAILLGTTAAGRPVSWQPGTLQNGHAVIVGGAGAGKTETIRVIAAELARQRFPVLMIDFHGDMAPEGHPAEIYTIAEGEGHYFNPLELDPTFPEITPLRATSEFVDAMAINFPTLGIQQREHLKQLVRIAYAQAGITQDPATWGRELRIDAIEAGLSTSDHRVAPTLRAYLADIFAYQLFSGVEKISIPGILAGGITRLNLRRLPEPLRFLYADLFLRKLYYSLQALGEIPRHPESDHERFRLFVIVDEAKLLVSERQGIRAVINKYASELRKFGVGLVLASQLASHFPEEVLANVEVKFCMRAQNGDQARKNARFFGVPESELLRLAVGEGILAMGGRTERLRITPSWRRGGDSA